MNWYASQCNGDWEHSFGVAIDTLDNPGWSLKIDLEDTDLEYRVFAQQEHNLMSDISWWTCKVENKKFLAYCGLRDFGLVLSTFRSWAEKPE